MTYFMQYPSNERVGANMREQRMTRLLDDQLIFDGDTELKITARKVALSTRSLNKYCKK